MAEILEVVDLEALRKEVREKYREVAEDPTAEYHFHTGRAHAVRLGYPATPLDQLPDYACEAFAGVGNPFFWGGPNPGEKVVIEDLPIEDGWADVVISNGVINLCPDKIGVYRQIFRVLKPGGRMTVADICLERPVPEEALRDIDLWTG